MKSDHLLALNNTFAQSVNKDAKIFFGQFRYFNHVNQMALNSVLLGKGNAKSNKIYLHFVKSKTMTFTHEARQ